MKGEGSFYMDAPRDDHTKGSKSDIERQISYDIAYMWSLKYDRNELIYKQKQTHRLKTNLWLPQGKGGGEG